MIATTINTYSVGLTLDAADYINKSTLAGNETRRLSRAIEEARTPAEKYTLTQGRLDKALEKGAINQQTYNRLLEAAKAKQDSLTEAINRTEAALKKEDSAAAMRVTQVRNLVAAYVGFGAIKKSISLAIDAEQASAAFEILTGSIEDSTKLLRDLRAYSDVSPLSTAGVRDAARLMLGFGLSIEEVLPSIKALGDIAGGNQQRFDSLTLAFSQASAAGRLMGQDVLQMVNAGFNPLQLIAEKTGETMAQLKKRMEDGLIPFEEVRAAFVSATEEGGKFHGMTERMAETMGGKLAIAMGDLEKAGIKTGEALSPLVLTLTDGFEKGQSALDGIVAAVEKMADGLGLVVALGKDAVTIFSAIASGETYDTMTGKIDATSKYLDMMDKRDKDRAAAALAETIMVSPEYKAKQNEYMLKAEAERDVKDAKAESERERIDSERRRKIYANQKSLNDSIGVAAGVNFSFTPKDLIAPTPGELLITRAVDAAVEAIKDNKFSRIR